MFASRLQRLSSEAQWLRLTGFLVAAIGLTVVVGWVSGVQILTTFTVAASPMVMNTAVCLILSATGLWALAGGGVGLARFCGALVVAICGLVLAQFIFGCSLGIDEFFWRHDFVPVLTRPGRMAPHAAAAMVLVGCSLLVTATGWKRQWLLPVMGGVALAFALLPLALFLSVRLASGESTSYRGMALPTMGSVLLLAVALIRRSGGGSKTDSWALPFMAAALGMLLSIGVILLQNSTELNEANRLVTHTYEVRGGVDYFVSEIARMESSARGYVLTGADSFQSRDEFHRNEAFVQLEKLRRLVADNPGQLARVQTLSQLTDGKFSQSSNIMRVRREQGADAAAKYLLAQSSSISSELVNLADKIKEEENRLLEVRTGDRVAIEQGLGTVELTGCLIALGLLAASLILARRSTAARQRAEETLVSVNQLQRAVLDGTDFSVIATKPNGMIQVFNAGAEKMLGYAREEMVDRQTPAILHVGEEVVARAAQLTSDFGRRVDPGFEVLVALAQKGATEEREWTYVRKDGSRLAVLLSVTALRNNQGGITGFLGIARDLTAQKASEAAREEINTRIGKLGEQVPGMIYQFRLKPDGTSSLPYVSEGIRQIYGLTPEEVRVDASRIFATIHPDDRERLTESIQTSARSLLPWFLEYRVRRIDGAERWLEGNARPERERDGSILWHGFISDVTGRKQLEDAVVRESTLLRTAIDLLPQSVYLKDTENRFLMANQALAKRVGKDSGAQLVGLRDLDLFGEKDAEKTRADEAAVLGGKAIFEQEETLFYQDKQSRTVLTTKVPFRAADGKIIGILGTGFDITEHKKAGIERALSEERLRLATEAAGVAVWEWDLVTGVVSWDRRMFEIHAIEPTASKEISYQIWAGAVHPEDASDQAAQLKALAETGGRGQREFRILRGPDRAVRFIQAAEMVVKDEQGRPVRMVGINIDITEPTPLPPVCAQ